MTQTHRHSRVNLHHGYPNAHEHEWIEFSYQCALLLQLIEVIELQVRDIRSKVRCYSLDEDAVEHKMLIDVSDLID